MERTEKNLAFLDTMNEIFEQNGLEKMNAGFRTGGSDAAYITECGIPCIDSLGTVGGLIHSINEFAYKDSLVERAKRLAAVVYCI
jgi:acetylornithine deacetylase/succinyl-diaminopimelate desuccinylase-like protein